MPETLDPQVAQLSREVLTELSPSEVPMFNALSRAYAKNPDQALKEFKSGDQVLGFGVVAGVLLTPVVISVAETVWTFISAELMRLAQQAGDHMADKAVEGIVAKVAAPKPGQKSGAQHTAALTPAQLAEVRHVAMDRALTLHLARDQAERLADAMVAKLAIAPN